MIVFSRMLNSLFFSLFLRFYHSFILQIESQANSASSEIATETQVKLSLILVGLIALGTISVGLVLIGLLLINRRRAGLKNKKYNRGLKEDDWCEKPLISTIPNSDDQKNE